MYTVTAVEGEIATDLMFRPINGTTFSLKHTLFTWCNDDIFLTFAENNI